MGFCCDPKRVLDLLVRVWWVALFFIACDHANPLSGNGDIFLTWVEAVTATPNPPLIHSLSYGSLAPEDPKIDIVTFNTDMCKLGLKVGIVLANGFLN